MNIVKSEMEKGGWTVKGMTKAPTYKPGRAKLDKYIEWRQSNPHGTYADYCGMARVLAAIARVVKVETGADVEVIISKHLNIYTEDLESAGAIRTLFGKTMMIVREANYEASRGLPAGVTFSFHI